MLFNYLLVSMQNFLQNNKFFFVSVVTLCDIFYSIFKRLLALMFMGFFFKIDFSLKISYVPLFAVFLCSFISQ